MKAHRLYMQVESDTVQLPPLGTLIGKRVEIIILEEPEVQPGGGDYSLLHDLAGKIDLDFDAIEKLRRTGCI